MNRSRPLTTAFLALTLATGGSTLAACGNGSETGRNGDDGGTVTSEETTPREDTTRPKEPPPREETPPRETPPREDTPPRENPTQREEPPPREENPPPNEPAPQGEREETAEEAESEPPDPPVTETPSAVVVERIVDGDTIEVSGDGRILPRDTSVTVRLLAIDAPETRDCYSSEATARIQQLLPLGSEVRVERDKDLKDRYDRYLLYVWNEQGEFVNESLVRTGHAKAVLFEPNDKRWPTISQAGETAELNESGLWSACGTETEAPPPPDTPPPAEPPEPAAPEPAAPEGAYPPGPPPGPDLDCSDLPGPVAVGSDDPHRLDRDGDGIGCE
ncbi:thermonuclease family protein [Streptomyces sp. ISL-99]|uniref:thermonuclease family protein n=1 Tax=Streptomyces sp. ISL-99 TaxID=2819193 RepID=UPI001C16A6D4|nr:thermonuclease family protein [Streptomyces sp. ISL-99]MBT2528046.1 thermonuclease family protein [Streptomyces sp. ISL-99]